MITRKYILRKAKEEIKADEDLVLLTIISSIVATFAIVLNNQYLLIGSMLIAPFFDPIISISVFFVFRRFRSFFSACTTLLLIIIIALTTSLITLSLIYAFTNHTITPIEFTLGKEYSIIAILLGITATYMWLWPKTSNTAAGVAVAISVIPPLVNIVVSIVDKEKLLPSFFTFATNIGGICIGSILVLIFKFRLRT